MNSQSDVFTIPLGIFEKFFLVREVTTRCNRCEIRVLDGELRFDVLRETVEALRVEFPVYFSTVILADNGIDLLAQCDLRQPIEDFLIYHPGEALSLEDFLDVLRSPLDPFKQGVFRLYYVGAPTPMLGVQRSHVAGDYETYKALFHRLNQIYRDLSQGKALSLNRPVSFAGYRMTEAQLRRYIPTRPIHDKRLGPLRSRTLREPVIEIESGDAVEAQRQQPIQNRHCRVLLSPQQFRRIIQQAQRFRATLTEYLGSALALTLNENSLPWAEQADDFIAISVPHNLRPAFKMNKYHGNVVFPIGVPFFSDELQDMAHVTPLFSQRLREGSKNYLYYVYPLRVVLRVAQTKIDWDTLLASKLQLRSVGNRLQLSPIIQPATVSYMGQSNDSGYFPPIGESHIVDWLFQGTIITYSQGIGAPQINIGLYWHPLFEDQIKRMISSFLEHLLDGSSEQARDVEWKLF